MKKQVLSLFFATILVTTSFAEPIISYGSEVPNGQNNSILEEEEAIPNPEDANYADYLEEKYPDDLFAASLNYIDTDDIAPVWYDPYGMVCASVSDTQYIPDEIETETVRNQNPYGTCWAFASTVAEEYSIKSREGLDLDLSELHLAYTHYHETIDPLGLLEGDSVYFKKYSSKYNFLNRGGNIEYAVETLLTWKGATAESDFPYTGASSLLATDSSKAASELKNSKYNTAEVYEQDTAHLNGYLLVNLKENGEIAKELILEYGALATSYYAYTSSGSGLATAYNDATYAYYCNDKTVTNHAITIVGWDDSFSKDNFIQTPEGDGAWLVRNSWGGTGYGYYGYFWMSYYDTSLKNAAYAFDAVSASNEEFYDHNYQYDGGILSAGYYLPSGSRMANVFTAQNYEKLEAVGFETPDVNVNYTVDIYILDNATDKPDSGIKVSTTTGMTTLAGFYHVPLSTDVDLIRGQVFAVVVKLVKSSGEDVIALIDTSYDRDSVVGYDTKSLANQSYINYYGNSNWQDVGADGANSNIRVKAYTNDVEVVHPTGISISQTTATLEKGQSLQLTANVLPANANDQGIIWSSDSQGIAIVDGDGMVSALNVGTTTIRAITHDGGLLATCALTVTGPTVVLAFTGTDSATFLNVGASTTLGVKNTVTNTTIPNSSITWTVDDSSVATVSNGMVTGKKSGATIVHATYSGRTIDRIVRVYFTATAVGAADGKVTISWSAVDGATKYRIHAQSAGSAYWDKDVTSGRTYTDTNANVSSNPPKYYLVYAFRNGEEQAFCTTQTVYVTYPISYALNGGTNNASNPSTYNTSSTVCLANPTRSGYTFKGWYTDSAFTKAFSCTSVGPVKVYAKWAGNSYKVTFNANGGTVSTSSKNVTNGSTYGTLPNPTRTGYIFAGWYTAASGGTKISSTTSVSLSGSQTLYAHWSMPGGVEGFVTRLYKECLDRDPDAGGYANWVNALKAKSVTGSSAAYGFLFSEEFKLKNYCDTCYTKKLYTAIMGRTYDSGGLNNWLNAQKSGMTREAVFNGFIGSTEFNNLCKSYGIVKGNPVAVPAIGTYSYGTCAGCKKADNVANFVTRLYSTCLSRQPDTAGLRTWVGQLKSGTQTGKQVAYGFMFSQEYLNKKTSNSTYVENLYQAMMGRASDAGGKQNWLNAMNHGMKRQEVFDGFAASQEFTNLCNSYGIKRG